MLLAGVAADSYSISDDTLHLFKGESDFLDLRLHQEPGSTLHVGQRSGIGVELSFLDPRDIHNGSFPLPEHSPSI